MLERARRLDWLARAGLLMLLAAVAVVSLRRALALDYDFGYFYRDAQYVWKHAELNPFLPLPGASEQENQLRRQLPFYLPAVPLLISPMAMAGPAAAAVVWVGLHLLALTCVLGVLRRWAAGGDGATTARRGTAVVTLAAILALPAIFEAARFNQISFMVLALVVVGVDKVLRDQPLTGGLLLATATIAKLLPAVLGVWLLLKRRWTALSAYLAALLLVGLLPCFVHFGYVRTLAYHREWLEYNLPAVAGGKVAAELREHFTDHRNQSIAAVVARWAWPEHRFAAAWQPVALSREACSAIAWAIAATLAIGLLWATRRGLRHLSAASAHAEAAAYCIAMLVFAPLVRQYYLVWTLPALVMLAEVALPGGAASRGRSERTWAAAGLLIWAAGMLAWVSETARALGAHLLMLVIVGLVVLRVAHRSRGAAAGAGAAT